MFWRNAMKRRKLRTFREFQNLQTDFDEITKSKENQLHNESRFEEFVSSQLSLEINKSRGKVEVGSTVVIQQEGTLPEEFTIVRPEEANESLGLISIKSRIGRSILGYNTGDFVKVPSAEGIVRYCILKVK
jgi:transcription elongation GreA/GreB family factor